MFTIFIWKTALKLRNNRIELNFLVFSPPVPQVPGLTHVMTLHVTCPLGLPDPRPPWFPPG